MACCVFPEGTEHPLWVPLRFVKSHGSPGPKDEETETGRLTLGLGTTEADTTDQRAAKEMAAGETDAGQ
jgi:hypothetical protein